MSESKKFIEGIKKAPLIAALPLILSACADDISGTVDVYVSKGPIDGAECTLYRANDNMRLAGPIITTQGYGSFGNVAFSGVGYVSCGGGSYTDEATGGRVSPSELVLRSAKWFNGGTFFVITPITEIAVAKASLIGGGIEANIGAMNQSVSDDFGISAFDITTVKPTDINENTIQDDAPGWYATVLAGISQYAANTTQSTANAISGLANEDIASGDFATALRGLAANDNHPAMSGNVNSKVVDDIIDGLGRNQDGYPGQTNSPGQPLDITSVNPVRGPETGGTQITLIGTGFVAGDDLGVTVGGNAATAVTVISSTQINAVTPAGLLTGSPVNIIFTNGDGEQFTFPNGFTYLDEDYPTISQVSPTTGSEAGGTVLTITGTNFASGNTLAVTVGGESATDISVDSPTQITAKTPPGTPTGISVDVVVTNGGGQELVVTKAFTYLSACQDCEVDANGCPF